MSTESSGASQPAKGFGLQFLSGEMAGKVVILQPGQKWILGRGADADLPIADKSLSRKHCELETTGETVKVTDLGSSNGSYVNKEKVKEAKLELGDQLRIGKSNMVLIEPPSNTENTSVLKKLAADSDSEVSGRLESLPLMDLLQLLSNSVKTGCLLLKRPPLRGTNPFQGRPHPTRHHQWQDRHGSQKDTLQDDVLEGRTL